MTAYLLTNHLLNFMAPAALLAVLLVLATRVFSRFFISKTTFDYSWRAQAAIIFVVNVLILAAGLLVFGHDGKMLTYTALVLGAAFCQWLLIKGWKA